MDKNDVSNRCCSNEFEDLYRVYHRQVKLEMEGLKWSKSSKKGIERPSYEVISDMLEKSSGDLRDVRCAAKVTEGLLQKAYDDMESRRKRAHIEANNAKRAVACLDDEGSKVVIVQQADALLSKLSRAD